VANENIILERADGVAVFIITSLSLALLAYEHLTTGFVDYGLLSLCVIYLLAFLLALALSGSLREAHPDAGNNNAFNWEQVLKD
jgi:hypothetical protein